MDGTIADATIRSKRLQPPCADLPALLCDHEGRPVTRPAEWPRRRQAIQRLMREIFVGTCPSSPPRLRHAETIASGPRQNGASAFQRIRLTWDGPVDLVFEITLWIPPGSGPFPLLLLAPRYYQMPWAEEALARGYVVCLFPGVDHMHHEADYPGYESVWQTFVDAYPEVIWTEIAAKGWLASRCLDYLLTEPSDLPLVPGQIGIIGHSRYGKQAIIAAAFDERITAVVARSSGSPASCPYRFASHTTFMETPDAFPGQWFLPSLRDFTGREQDLPMDAHGWLALVAPRHLLLHTATNDGGDPSFGVERAFRQGREVYCLLGHPEHLHIAYRQGGHNDDMGNPHEAIISQANVDHNLSWLDQAFGRQPVEATAHGTQLYHDFSWSAWRAGLDDAACVPPDGSALQGMEWVLGEAPTAVVWDGQRRFLSATESGIMSHDRWALPGVERIPVCFGEGIRGNLYVDPQYPGPLPAVIWLHPFSTSSGYTGGYNVQDTTIYHRLAQRGYAVLAFDQCGFGLRLSEGRDFYRVYPHWSRLGRMVHDVRCAVDFLIDGCGAAASPVPAIRADSVSVLGYSMGGMVGLYAAAMDRRLASVACFAGFTPLRTDTDARPTGGIRRLWDWYALAPRLGLFHGREEAIPYDYDDVLSWIAPRPCLIVSPTRDRDATFDDVCACVGRAGEAWGGGGDGQGLTHDCPDDISRFQRDQHERFLAWMDELLPR